MKRRLFLTLFALFLLFALTGCGEEYELNWSVDGTTLAIHDGHPFGDILPQEEWRELGNQIDTVVISDKICCISDYAFQYLPNLKTVHFSNSAHHTSIGVRAFAGTSLILESLPGNLLDIDAQAFAGCTMPETLTIPESTDSIKGGFWDSVGLKEIRFENPLCKLGGSDFQNCKELTDVYLPEKLQTVPGSCFQDCTALVTITLPNYVSKLGREAFAGCTALKKIVLSEKLEILYEGVFRNCTALESIRLPEGVTQFQNLCFANCTGLTEFHFPASLEHFNETAFLGCSNLTKFTVEPGNAWLSADKNGYLYDLSGTKLLLVPPAVSGSLTLPDGIQSIGKRAFSICPVTEIIVPDSVTRLENGAFFFSMSEEPYTSQLKDVYLPASIQSVGINLFLDLDSSLEHIYYAGTEEQWNQIENIAHTNEHFREYLVFETPAPQATGGE